MAKEYLIQKETLDGLANDIAEKSGVSTPMLPSEMRTAVQGIKTKVDLSWHQCPETVRNYIAEAQSLYPTTENVTVIHNYATPHGQEINNNTKPVGFTFDNETFYDNTPNIATPFSTNNYAGTITALDSLRWYNTTSRDAFSKPADRPNKPMYPRGRNTRDLGGWACNGGTVKYGMLVRGSEPNPVDKELMVDKIGIKTEVQLLPLYEQDEGYIKQSAWGIDWLGNETEKDSIYGIDSNLILWKKILSGIFDSIIANKPVYFHCGIGADRTGIMAIMLEGILGISQSDIDIDYELTNFAFGWQDLEGGIYRSRAYSTHPGLVNSIMNIPLKNGLSDTFENHCISFAISLGIPVSKINAFRTACINGTPSIVPESTQIYTITQNGTNVNFSNNDTTVIDSYEYTVDLTPNNGYIIDTIEVRMNGKDITSSVVSGIKKPLYYEVINSLIDCTAKNFKRNVIKEQSYVEDIVCNKKCYFDGLENFSVTMNGEDITSQVVFFGGVITESYKIFTTLINCSIDNSSSEILSGTAYQANITPNENYSLDNAAIIIKMNNEDITTSAYENGQISILAVTGDLNITIIAKINSDTNNLFPQQFLDIDGVSIYNNGLGYKNNYRIRGILEEGDGAESSISGYLDVEGYNTLIISNAPARGGISGWNLVCYDNTHTPSETLSKELGGTYASQNTPNGSWTIPSGVKYIRFSANINPINTSVYLT